MDARTEKDDGGRGFPFWLPEQNCIFDDDHKMWFEGKTPKNIVLAAVVVVFFEHFSRDVLALDPSPLLRLGLGLACAACSSRSAARRWSRLVDFRPSVVRQLGAIQI